MNLLALDKLTAGQSPALPGKSHNRLGEKVTGLALQQTLS